MLFDVYMSIPKMSPSGVKMSSKIATFSKIEKVAIFKMLPKIQFWVLRSEILHTYSGDSVEYIRGKKIKKKFRSVELTWNCPYIYIYNYII